MKKQIFDYVNSKFLSKIKEDPSIIVNTTSVMIEDLGYLKEARNYITNKAYTGINRVLLHAGYYLTYNQCKQLNGRVKKGAKAYPCYYAIEQKEYKLKDIEHKKLIKMNEDDYNKLSIFEKEKFKILEVTKHYEYDYYTIFNIEDCEIEDKIKWELPKEEPTLRIDSDKLDTLSEYIISRYLTRENINFATLLNIEAPYYNKKEDKIRIKCVQNYPDTSSYYSDIFHELIHSTGHKERLNRDSLLKSKRVGDTFYKEEELIAELGSLYILNSLNLLTKRLLDDGIAYIMNWVNTDSLANQIEENPTFIVSLFSKVERAKEYIFKSK